MTRLLRGRRVRPVEAFLLEMAHCDAERGVLLTRARHLPVDKVVSEATEHGMVALIAEAAMQSPETFPALTSALRGTWARHVGWTMRLLVELSEAATSLDQAGLGYAVVKGPALGAHLYGDPMRRASSDLDLLVSRADRELVVEQLRLHTSENDFTDADVADSGQMSMTLRRGTPLDLHWELVNAPAARRESHLVTSELLARRRQVRVGGTLVSTLDPVDTVLHLVSHTLVSGGHRLVWYVDLDRAMRDPQLDPDLLRCRAADARLGTGLAVLLARCARTLDTPTPDLKRVDRSQLWTSLGQPVQAVCPPSGSSSRLSRGQLYYRATRQDARSSLRTLAGLIQEARGRQRTSVRSAALISLEPWDTTWRRNQHLVSELVGGGYLDRVLFVEPPSPGRGSRRWSPAPGIDIVRPALVIPKRVGGLAFAGWWLRRTALRRLDLIWVNDPDLGVHCLSATRPAVYDVTDDWRTFGQAPRVLRRLVAAEGVLAQRARTIVCSQVLAERWRDRYSLEATVLHNGIDVASFASPEPRPLVGPNPHLGYIGTLHSERLDLQLVVRLARTAGLGTIHLVGPSSLTPTESSQLEAAGVVLHGAVPSGDVASWMCSMDALISPHLVSDFTLSLDAIKSYEYLATGLPVVATPTSGFQLLEAPQLIVATADTFAEAVTRGLTAGPGEPLQDSGWDIRAALMARLLGARERTSVRVPPDLPHGVVA